MRKTFGLAMAAVAAVLAVMLAGAAAPSAPATATSSHPANELTLDLGGKVTLDLIQIPAGKFLMGSPETEKGRDKDNEVQHEVTISKPFFMGITHVTVDQFAAFAKDSGYKTEAEKDGWSNGIEIKDGKLVYKRVEGGSWHATSFDQQGNCPVVQVSWNDAQAFCGWLSKRSGKAVTLPTEAQWEYACRAGTTTAYPWGDNPDDGKGRVNWLDQSAKKNIFNAAAHETFSNWDDGFVFTSPVASFKPNAFGLYDMNGNAWQWCQDRYGKFEKGAVIDPIGAATGNFRVLRGGAWDVSPRNCRSASRFWIRQSDYLDFCGFRVVAMPAGLN